MEGNLHEEPVDTRSAGNVRTYVLVFVALLIVTGVEIALASLGVARQAQTTLFLLLSMTKAALVAAYFMHLRGDSPLYTYVFLTPAAMFLLFALLTVAS
jgi:cytochrome c oxidase subunit 4